MIILNSSLNTADLFRRVTEPLFSTCTKIKFLLCDQMKMVLGANLTYANREVNVIATMHMFSLKTLLRSGYCSTVIVSWTADTEVDFVSYTLMKFRVPITILLISPLMMRKCIPGEDFAR